ncbi:MAG: Rid family hydrolase [Pseudorhodoplanes sp.]|uniref:Rid family hydrolase n=1 Tax=Pseudorhodoplanes sp. TaxID=1934341 RepID=UPI003D0D0F4D
MERRNISSGSRFEEEGAYSRVVMAGPMIFLSGCSGFDYATGNISDDVVRQTEQTFENISAALTAAEITMKDVVRLNIIMKNSSDYRLITPVLRRHLDAVRPATTTWQGDLMDARMKVEIEVTAIRSVPHQGF